MRSWFSIGALTLLSAACAHRAPRLADDLTFSDVRVVEARAHPIYENWTKAPPLTQLIELDYASATDFVAYASRSDLPFIQLDIAVCDEPGRLGRPLQAFAGQVYWNDVALNGWTDDAALIELRGRRTRGEALTYRSFIEIAVNAHGAVQPAYDLLRTNGGLCLRVTFSDMKSRARHTNTVFIPAEACKRRFWRPI